MVYSSSYKVDEYQKVIDKMTSVKVLAETVIKESSKKCLRFYMINLVFL